MRRAIALRTGALVAWLVPSALRAQGIHGTVKDRATGDALRGALLTLLDSGGTIVGAARANDSAAFTLRAPRDGNYRLQARFVGYRPYRSLPLLLEAPIVFGIAIELERQPQLLPEVRVEAERDYVQRRLGPGVSVRALQGRVYGPSELSDAARTAGTAFDLLRVLAPTSFILDHDRRCLRRAARECARVIVDDAPFEADLQLISSFDVAVVAVVHGVQASTWFGSDADVIMVYLRNGREPPARPGYRIGW